MLPAYSTTELWLLGGQDERTGGGNPYAVVKSVAKKTTKNNN